jgi:hypothetical protein
MTLEVIPALGGKISSLVSAATGREWLWTNPHLPRRNAAYSDSHVALHDTGGIDECFPTVDACICPDQASPWNGIELPDHGELIHQHWRTITAELNQSGGAVLALEASGVRMPYRFRRTLRLGPEGALLGIDYELENLAPHPLPWTWCIHPVFNVEPGMRIELPEATPIRCAAGSGDMPAAADETFVWPRTAKGYDLSRIPDPGQEQFTCKLFAGPMEQGSVALVCDKEALRLFFTGSQVDHVAIWLNCAGWTGADTPNYFNAVIEPAIGDSDSLTEAITERGSARWLAPGATVQWQLKLALADIGTQRGS